MKIKQLFLTSKSSFYFKINQNEYMGFWGYFKPLSDKEENIVKETAMDIYKDTLEFINNSKSFKHSKKLINLSQFLNPDLLIENTYDMFLMHKIYKELEKEYPNLKLTIYIAFEYIGKTLVITNADKNLIKKYKAVDISKEIEDYFLQKAKELEKFGIKLTLGTERRILHSIFKKILKEVNEVTTIIGLDLQRSIQPINKTDAKIKNDLVKIVDETRRKPIKSIEGEIRTIYEQMLLHIISQLVYNAKQPIKDIIIGIKPKKFAKKKLEILKNGILIIGKDTLKEMFQLKDIEIQMLFIGKNSKNKKIAPACEKLSERIFKIHRANSFRIGSIVKTDITKDKHKHIVAMEIDPVFNRIDAYYIDDLKRLRHLKNIIKGTKEEKLVLSLRNLLVTLQNELTYNFDTLGKKIGISYDNNRHVSKRNNTIIKCLDYLKKTGYIDYTLTKKGVKVKSLISYKPKKTMQLQDN